MGFGMLLQRDLGLRPSEVLDIRPEDCALPEHVRAATPRATIALGMRTGTKAKRAQAVTLRDPLLLGLLRWACSTSEKGTPIIGYTYENYRRLLLRLQLKLGLSAIGFSPHSPRSGFATEAIADGEDFVRVREAGRWLADTSLRTYVDLARVASIATELELAGLATAIDYTELHIRAFFVAARPYLWELDAAKRVAAQPAGREVLPAVAELSEGGLFLDGSVDAGHTEQEAFSHASTDKPQGRGRGGGRGERRGRRGSA